MFSVGLVAERDADAGWCYLYTQINHPKHSPKSKTGTKTGDQQTGKTREQSNSTQSRHLVKTTSATRTRLQTGWVSECVRWRDKEGVCVIYNVRLTGPRWVSSEEWVRWPAFSHVLQRWILGSGVCGWSQLFHDIQLFLLFSLCYNQYNGLYSHWQSSGITQIKIAAHLQ